jgi:hypothetical protein
MEFGAQYFVVLLLLVPGLAVLYVWGFRRSIGAGAASRRLFWSRRSDFW